MEKYLILFITLLPLFYCQLPLYKFKEQFLLEIKKFKPDFGDKTLDKEITKIAKTYVVESSYTNKIVDLNHVLNNCHLDFEINLVKSETLPSSDHLINHIIVGGLIIPGQKPSQNKNDLWAGNVGVAIKKDANTVYSLVFDLRVHFEKSSFIEKAGIDLSDINEDDLVNSIFYNKCLEIAEKEMSELVIDDEKEEK